MKSNIFLLTLFLAVPMMFFISPNYTARAYAGDDTITIGETIKIHSDMLGEDRLLYVYLPDGYDQSQQRYPVLFCLDANEVLFHRATGTVRYLRNIQRIPPMILIAISNIANQQDMRSRDMFPMKIDQIPNSGGADKFLTFICNELIPFVSKNVRSNNEHILFGESNAAMFAIFALLTRPEMFDGYITSSPPFASGDYFLVKKAEDVFKNWSLSNKYLYISYGSMDLEIIRNAIPNFAQVLNNLNPKGLQWKFKPVRNEGHNPHTTLHDGLLYIYTDWSPTPSPEMVPTGGIFNQGETVIVMLKSEFRNIRYTIDGKEPTRNSYLYNKPIIVSEPITIKAKVFAENKKESETVIGIFQNNDFQSAATELSDIKRGITYNYYEGMWFELPEFDSLKPNKSGITKDFDLKCCQRTNGFAVEFSGYLYIQKDGAYRFYVRSDDGSQVLLHNQLIVDLASPHDMKFEKSWQVLLKAGYHPITIRYFQYIADYNLAVKYEGPDTKKQYIPEDVLFYQRN